MYASKMNAPTAQQLYLESINNAVLGSDCCIEEGPQGVNSGGPAYMGENCGNSTRSYMMRSMYFCGSSARSSKYKWTNA